MNVVRAAKFRRSAQALARVQAETFTVHQAVSIAVAGGEGDCWHRFLPEGLKPAYQPEETTKGERARVRQFEFKHGV